MKLLETFSITLFLALTCLASHAQTNQNPQRALGHTVWFYEYLPEMADRLNCYFTLETKQNGNPAVVVDNIFFSNDPSITTVKALVDKLHKEAVGFVVLQDKLNPQIIHIIDAGLYQDPTYPINQKVTISYTGLLRGLPDAIGKKLPAPLITQRSFFGPIMAIDSYTKVKVVAQGRDIRGILTDYVPLEKYNCFLWTAQTLDINGKIQTQVNYSGQATVKIKSGSTSFPIPPSPAR